MTFHEMSKTRGGRARLLALVLAGVVVAGTVDGGAYLCTRGPSGYSRILGRAAISAFHPLIGLALPVIAFPQGGIVSALIASVPLILEALLVLAARRYVARARRRDILWVALTGFATYWLTTRMLFASVYGSAWY